MLCTIALKCTCVVTTYGDSNQRSSFPYPLSIVLPTALFSLLPPLLTSPVTTESPASSGHWGSGGKDLWSPNPLHWFSASDFS